MVVPGPLSTPTCTSTALALALGIDYALFIVVRYRAAREREGSTARQTIAETVDTAGKAVLLSGANVLISLSAVMLVPSPSFRSIAGGIMRSVVLEIMEADLG